MSHGLQDRNRYESRPRNPFPASQRDQYRIISKIETLADNPRPPGCVKLAGISNLWRIRAGVYRVIYQIQDDRLLVIVTRVGHRRGVYRDM